MPFFSNRRGPRPPRISYRIAQLQTTQREDTETSSHRSATPGPSLESKSSHFDDFDLVDVKVRRELDDPNDIEVMPPQADAAHPQARSRRFLGRIRIEIERLGPGQVVLPALPRSARACLSRDRVPPAPHRSRSTRSLPSCDDAPGSAAPRIFSHWITRARRPATRSSKISSESFASSIRPASCSRT